MTRPDPDRFDPDRNATVLHQARTRNTISRSGGAIRSRLRTRRLVAVDDDADVYTDEDEAEDDAAEAEAEGQVGTAACLARPHLGRHPVAGRDRRAALGRAQDREDADQPATAQRHVDRVAHVVIGWILQRSHRLHINHPTTAASDTNPCIRDMEFQSLPYLSFSLVSYIGSFMDAVSLLGLGVMWWGPRRWLNSILSGFFLFF